MSKLLIFILSCSCVAASVARASETREGSGGASGTGANGSSLSDDERRACSLGASGRVAIASIYGSCDAAQVVNPKDGNGSPPTDTLCNASARKVSEPLSRVWARSSCKKETSQKPTYSQSEPRVEFKNGEVNPAPKGATDCSGIVSAQYLRAGLNLVPNQAPGKLSTTAEMVKFDKSNSCFDSPAISPAKPILSGDVIVVNNGESGHVWTIDRVGEKPFGEGGCNSFSPDKWDFTILESSGSKSGNAGGGKQGSGEGVGISAANVHASNSGNSKRYEAYKTLWQAACGKSSKPVSNGQPAARMLRHIGSKKAGCVAPQSKLRYKNESCVSSCDNLKSDWLGKAE